MLILILTPIMQSRHQTCGYKKSANFTIRASGLEHTHYILWETCTLYASLLDVDIAPFTSEVPIRGANEQIK